MTGDHGPALPFVIGVVSDTHGMLSDAAYAALLGSDAIVHAGDVGGAPVLDLLETIAPVVLVRGNNRDLAEAGSPQIADVVLGGVRVMVSHRSEDLPPAFAPAAAPVRLIVTGHTHEGSIDRERGVVRVNPGSPTQPRRGSAATVALVQVRGDGSISARLVTVA